MNSLCIFLVVCRHSLRSPRTAGSFHSRDYPSDRRRDLKLERCIHSISLMHCCPPITQSVSHQRRCCCCCEGGGGGSSNAEVTSFCKSNGAGGGRSDQGVQPPTTTNSSSSLHCVRLEDGAELGFRDLDLTLLAGGSGGLGGYCVGGGGGCCSCSCCCCRKHLVGADAGTKSPLEDEPEIPEPTELSDGL
jgi:hypothetical protein